MRTGEKTTTAVRPAGRCRTPRVWVVIVGLLYGCAGADRSATENRSEVKSSPTEVAATEVPAFQDAAIETGLVFQHENGMSGQRYMPEMVAPGIALVDYDRDGDLDVFLVQGRRLGPDVVPDEPNQPRHRLFRNEWISVPGSGAGPGEQGTKQRSVLRFSDVSEEAGLTFSDYGMGVATGDFDGDGWVDLYLTSLGVNRLLRNTGRGTFEDVTHAAGLAAESAWSTSAAWFDFDRDGQLDLFVCRYLLWSYQVHKPCASLGGRTDYCGPKAFEAARSRLYRNLGGGRFEDVSRSSRISSAAGAALGVVAADVDGDGWVDLFVANDGMPNHLWMNQRDGRFQNDATPRGCAVNAQGNSEANMGLIATDFRNVGRMDLFITHLKNEHSTYYENLGEGQFADVTSRAGLDATTRSFTGFGTVPIDYDNDGWLDIFAANGEVRIIDAQVGAGRGLPMRQACVLLRNQGTQPIRFAPVVGGAYLQVEEVGRGVAVGDLDNDGDLDLVVGNAAGPTRLLLNAVGQDQHWLGLRVLEGTAEAPRDALQALVQVDRLDGSRLTRRCATDGSYLSASDPRVLFGLKGDAAVNRIVVTWPDQTREEFPPLEVDRYHELWRGTGKSLP